MLIKSTKYAFIRGFCQPIKIPTMSSTPLSAEIFDVMHELLHVFRAHMRTSMEAVHPDLTSNEVRVLMYVGRHPGRSQKELVEHSHTDKAQMARILTQLEEQGWLHRSASAEDRRVRCLHLSETGQALFAQLRQVRAHQTQLLLAGCPPEVQQQLLTLLGMARHSAEQADGHTDI